MNINRTPIADVLLIDLQVYRDPRGEFCETFNQNQFQELIGCQAQFVQDNESKSKQGVLRGLHLQSRRPQGKLIRVTQGEIYDVFVDCRKESETFGQWSSAILSEQAQQLLWIPQGLAHGFFTLSHEAVLQYKVTDFYDPGYELTLDWRDPSLAIDWPSNIDPLLSDKDSKGLTFQEVIEALYEEKDFN